MVKHWLRNSQGVSLIALLALLLLLSVSAYAQTDHGGGLRPESTRTSPIALNPAAGSDIGAVFEAFLSPHQEGGEEEVISIQCSFFSQKPTL